MMRRSTILVLSLLVLLAGALILPPTHTAHAAEEIYVDVNHGSDQNGDGSQSNPYKTITKAVGIADSSTAHSKIHLASGVYSSSSGEDFPLTLDNIDLIGNPDDPSKVEVSGQIRLKNGAVSGTHFYQTLAAENSTIKKNVFSGMENGIYMSGVSIIINNNFNDVGTCIDANLDGGQIEIIENNFTESQTAINGDFKDSEVLISDNKVSKGSWGFLINIDEGAYITLKGNDISVDHGSLGLSFYASGKLLVEENIISADKPVLIRGKSSGTIDMGGGTLGSSGNNVFQSSNEYYHVIKHELPAYSGTIYAKNNTWKDSTGSEFQPPEVLEGPANTEHFYIKNTGNKIRFAGTEDTAPPSVTIDNAPSGKIDYKDVTFEWTSSDNVTATSDLVYSYILEGHDASWSDWTTATSNSYTDLPDGSYTFKVEAKDEAGNITSTPPTASFTVDLAEPNLSFTREGWKMIGFPYPVDWGQAGFSAPSSFATDGAGNVRLVTWDPKDQLYLNHYSDSSYVTLPWGGYWIKVSSASSENPATITVKETSKAPSASGLRTALPASVESKELEYPPKPEGAENSEPIRVATYSTHQGGSIKFAALNAEGKVEEIEVSVFDSNGQKIWQNDGKGKELIWSTEGVPNGIYLYKTSLKVGGRRKEFGVNKLLLIK